MEDHNRNCVCWNKSIFGKDFQLLANLGILGLDVYRHVNRVTARAEAPWRAADETYIIDCANNLQLTKNQFSSVLDLKLNCCSKCRCVIERVQNILRNIAISRDLKTIGLCSRCLSRSKAICKCRNVVKYFNDIKTNLYLDKWIKRIEKVLGDLENKDSFTRVTRTRSYSDYYDFIKSDQQVTKYLPRPRYASVISGRGVHMDSPYNITYNSPRTSADSLYVGPSSFFSKKTSLDNANDFLFDDIRRPFDAQAKSGRASKIQRDGVSVYGYEKDIPFHDTEYPRMKAEKGMDLKERRSMYDTESVEKYEYNLPRRSYPRIKHPTKSYADGFEYTRQEPIYEKPYGRLPTDDYESYPRMLHPTQHYKGHNEYSKQKHVDKQKYGKRYNDNYKQPYSETRQQNPRYVGDSEYTKQMRANEQTYDRRYSDDYQESLPRIRQSRPRYLDGSEHSRPIRSSGVKYGKKYSDAYKEPYTVMRQPRPGYEGDRGISKSLPSNNRGHGRRYSDDSEEHFPKVKQPIKRHVYEYQYNKQLLTNEKKYGRSHVDDFEKSHPHFVPPRQHHLDNTKHSKQIRTNKHKDGRRFVDDTLETQRGSKQPRSNLTHGIETYEVKERNRDRKHTGFDNNKKSYKGMENKYLDELEYKKQLLANEKKYGRRQVDGFEKSYPQIGPPGQHHLDDSTQAKQIRKNKYKDGKKFVDDDSEPQRGIKQPRNHLTDGIETYEAKQRKRDRKQTDFDNNEKSYEGMEHKYSDEFQYKKRLLKNEKRNGRKHANYDQETKTYDEKQKLSQAGIKKSPFHNQLDYKKDSMVKAASKNGKKEAKDQTNTELNDEKVKIAGRQGGHGIKRSVDVKSSSKALKKIITESDVIPNTSLSLPSNVEILKKPYKQGKKPDSKKEELEKSTTKIITTGKKTKSNESSQYLATTVAKATGIKKSERIRKTEEPKKNKGHNKGEKLFDLIGKLEKKEEGEKKDKTGQKDEEDEQDMHKKKSLVEEKKKRKRGNSTLAKSNQLTDPSSLATNVLSITEDDKGKDMEAKAKDKDPVSTFLEDRDNVGITVPLESIKVDRKDRDSILDLVEFRQSRQIYEPNDYDMSDLIAKVHGYYVSKIPRHIKIGSTTGMGLGVAPWKPKRENYLVYGDKIEKIGRQFISNNFDLKLIATRKSARPEEKDLLNLVPPSELEGELASRDFHYGVKKLVIDNEKILHDMAIKKSKQLLKEMRFAKGDGQLTPFSALRIPLTDESKSKFSKKAFLENFATTKVLESIPEDDQSVIERPQILAPHVSKETVPSSAASKKALEHKAEQAAGPSNVKGVIHYVLSNKEFIDKGWTQLPTETIVRKINIYKMHPAKPELNWFELNRYKKIVNYDSGEKFAEIDDGGSGRWFYKNGRLAMNYYNAEELNARQRIVIYSSGEPDERSSRPVTVLAMFDYLGNGVVFDHNGKIRLKYNQCEGVVLDKSISPETTWKWHSLNDPPILQQVLIDTPLAIKDPNILILDKSKNKVKPRPDNEEMLAIEYDNFIREKSKSMNQSFRPYQIKMKAFKINKKFSMRVVDQTNIYLNFREGNKILKVNVGMILDHHEIIDTDTADVGKVLNSLERYPARSDSLQNIQKNISHAQRVERLRQERKMRLMAPPSSADRLMRPTSRPLRQPLATIPNNSLNCFFNKKTSLPSIYNNTRSI